MKINWGTAIVIAFVLFISFIMYFVINMSTNKKYNHDLVTADYYQQELQYQEDINKEENTNAKNYQLALKPTSEGLLLSFPKQTDAKKIIGLMKKLASQTKYMLREPIEVNENISENEQRII